MLLKTIGEYNKIQFFKQPCRPIFIICLVFIRLSSSAQESKLIIPQGNIRAGFSMQFTADEEHLITYDDPHIQPIIKLWESKTNRLVNEFIIPPDENIIRAVSYSHNLKRLYCLTENKIIGWNTATYNIFLSIDIDKGYKMLLNEESKTLAIAASNDIFIIDSNTGIIQKRIDIEAFEKGNFLNVEIFSDNNTSFLYRLKNKFVLIKLPDFKESIFYVENEDIESFSPELIDFENNRLLLRKKDNQGIYCYDMKNGDLINTLTNLHLSYGHTQAGKNDYLIKGNPDLLWNVKTGKIRKISVDWYSGYDGYYTLTVISSSSRLITRSQANIDSIPVWKYRFHNPENMEKVDSISTKYFGNEYDPIIAGKQYIVSTFSQKYPDGTNVSAFPLIWYIGSPSTRQVPAFFNKNSLERAILYSKSNSFTEKDIISNKFFHGYGSYSKDLRFSISPSKKFVLIKAGQEKGLYSINKTDKGLDSTRLLLSIKTKDDNTIHINDEKFSEDEKYISFLIDSTLNLVNTTTGKIISQKKLKYANAKFTLTNDLFVYTNENKSISLFNLINNNIKNCSLPIHDSDLIQHISIDKNKKIIVTLSSCVFLIEYTGKIINRFENYAFRTAVMKGNSTYLSTENGNIVIVDNTTRKPINYLIDSTSIDYTLMGPTSDINFKVFRSAGFRSPEIKLIIGDERLIVITNDSLMRVWNIRLNKLEWKRRCNIRVDEAVLNEKNGKVLLLSYGRNGGLIIEKEIFNQAEIYELVNGNLLFSTDNEERAVKASPPESVEETLKQPLSVYGEKGSEKMSILDFSKKITYHYKTNTLCASYSSLCLIVKIDSQLKKKWYSFSGAAESVSANDFPFILINKFTNMQIFSLLDSTKETILDSLSNRILDFVERNGRIALYGSKYTSKNIVIVYDLIQKKVIFKKEFPFDIVNFKESLSPKGNFLLIKKYSTDKNLLDSTSLIDINSGKTTRYFSEKSDDNFFTIDNDYLVILNSKNADSSQTINLQNKYRSYLNISYLNNKYLGDGWLCSGDELINLDTKNRFRVVNGFYFAQNKEQFIGFSKSQYLLKSKKTGNIISIPISINSPLMQTLPLNNSEGNITINFTNELMHWDNHTLVIKNFGSTYFTPKHFYQNSDSTFIVLDDMYGFEYGIKSLKTRVSFMPSGNNKLNLLLPDQYYFINKNDVSNYYFNRLGEIYSLQQLDIKYNRPDKVLLAIDTSHQPMIKSYYKAYEKRIKRLGIDTTSFRSGFSMPEANFQNRNNINYERQQEEITLHITGNDSTYFLDRFNVWINEIPLFGIKGVSLKNRKSHKLDTTLMVRLSQGINNIETSIINTNGIESYRTPLLVNYTPASPEKPKLYIVGIGIDHFKSSNNNLSWSVKDVRDLCYSLNKTYKSNIIIDTLFNQQVTVGNIKSLKQKLLQSSINDKVIVVYSGHGLLSKDYDYFLSTYDTNFEKPEQGGLPYDAFENLLDSIPARQKLMLLDACHSGEVDKEEMAHYKQVQAKLDSSGILMKDRKGVVGRPKGTELVDTDSSRVGMKNSFELMQELFVNVGRSTGATVISAAGGTQFALEKSNLKNGVFTYSILEYMQTHPTCKVSELRQYVNQRVSELSFGMQVPTTRSETLNYDWNVW